MAQKIKVGAVSYLNTKPLIYGFEQGSMKDEIELIFDYPANIAALLIQDKIDIGLVPVAIIPLLKEHHIVSDYGIACDGEVASVCLFSDVPLQEIETILMDYQSRTSVALLKILLKEHWKINPALIAGTADYENKIAGTTAGLVIGDRALEQRQKSKYINDLGTAWKEMTGLPFVFAAWVSNKELPAEFIEAFNKANETGFIHLDEVIRQNPLTVFDLKSYYTDFVKFKLNSRMQEAKALFLRKISTINALDAAKI
ncbi:MAG: menaquinone biosynthesis protein [Chitinophagaceae bacterium]|nr:menaquinone biosynthesis protein [Chitinophagaceae bacterium]